MREHIVQQIGTYHPTRLLGRSEFAEVYLAEHMRYGTRVALKVLRTRLSGMHAQIFQRQVQVIARFKHPHILSLTDAGTQQDIPYLIMEYAPGGTLRQRHPQGERLDLPTVIGYTKQIAQGLQYAHEQQLLHRALKPENILLDARGKLVVGDFRIPVLIQNESVQTATEAIAYMAPEQIQGHPNAASDQYALAVLIYEWLSGERPFTGSARDIATQHNLVSPPSLREKRPNLNPLVARVVHTALSKDYRQRFKSILAFAEALENASTTYPLRTTGALNSMYPTSVSVPALPPAHEVKEETPTPQPSVERARKPARKVSRRALTTGLIGLGVVSLVGGGGAWFVLSRIAARGTIRTTFRAHKGHVRSATWSSDGSRIVSTSDDRSVQVWSVDTLNLDAYQEYQAYTVYRAEWSPDNKRIACASDDQTIRIWNATDGRNAYTYSGHSGAVYSVSWSSDGQRIASASKDHTVQVWSATDGGSAYTYQGHTEAVYSASWSPDKTYIASASADKTVRIWGATNGSDLYVYRGHSMEVRRVVWSPDGKRIASAGADQTVQVWNPTDGGNVYTYRGHSGIVNDIVWSPDGQRIASASADHTVHIWNAADGSHAYIFRGHSAAVNSVSWSHDGMWIATASDDRTVQVWDAGWLFHIG